MHIAITNFSNALKYPCNRFRISDSIAVQNFYGWLKTPYKYSVIDIGGTQKIVQEGQHYSCNRLQVELGSTIRFGRVLALKECDEFHLGSPWVKNASVEAE